MKGSRWFTPALVAAALSWGAVAWALSSGDLIKQGVSVLKDGKAQEALDLFTKAQHLDPQSPRPLGLPACSPSYRRLMPVLPRPRHRREPHRRRH